MTTKTSVQPDVWRVWIDNANRIVSFHEISDGRMLEFRNPDLLMRCVEQYAAEHYRYQ